MKLNFWENWPEYVGFVLLVIGFFVALGAGSAVIAYILVLAAGLMGGRLWFKAKEGQKVPWIIILFGFLVGFTLGSRYGDVRLIVFFYVFGIALGYYLHDKGIGTEVYYPVPFHLQECFQFLGYRQGAFPVAEQACKDLLALPTYPELTADQQELVVKTVCEYYER